MSGTATGNLSDAEMRARREQLANEHRALERKIKDRQELAEPTEQPVVSAPEKQTDEVSASAPLPSIGARARLKAEIEGLESMLRMLEVTMDDNSGVNEQEMTQLTKARVSMAVDDTVMHLSRSTKPRRRCKPRPARCGWPCCTYPR